MAPTESRAKKRTANSQGGPDTKKRHTEASKPKTKTVPVTSTIQDEESSDQASSSSDVEMQDAHQIQDVVLAQAGTGASQFFPFDPRWRIPHLFLPTDICSLGYESHQTQKQILAQRKASKPNAAMMEQAKRIWASARKRDLPRAEREKLCKQLADLINGKVVEVVFKHDASRIIQTVRQVLAGIRQSPLTNWSIARQVWKKRRERDGRIRTERALSRTSAEQVFQGLVSRPWIVLS